MYVITAEDIGRSGAATLPEALRMAPSLHVARINGYACPIGVRGMNQSGNSYSNKLLVPSDGRSVYTPLFSGVFRDAQMVMLEDVERIEVISGPGRRDVGPERGRWRHQHHHAFGARHPGQQAVLQAATDGATVSFRHGGTTNGVAWRAFGQTTRRDDSELATALVDRVDNTAVAFLPARHAAVGQPVRAGRDRAEGTLVTDPGRPSRVQRIHRCRMAAERAPSRLDGDAFLPGRPPYLLRGGPRVRGQVTRVAELGVRGQPAPGLSYSATLFHHDYDYLRTTEFDSTGIFITFDSLMEGRSSGIEAWGSWRAVPRWRLSAGWTAMHQKLRLKPGSTDAGALMLSLTGENLTGGMGNMGRSWRGPRSRDGWG